MQILFRNLHLALKVIEM